MDKNLISLSNVHKSFGANHVLRGLTLNIKQGESYVVLGGSGTGKSVMLKCILGLIDIDQGDIAIDQTSMITGDAADVSTALNSISMLFQGSALFDSLTVWENIFFQYLGAKKITRLEARAQAQERLEQVGLSPTVRDLYPSELSGGMQRRVALARAVSTKPKIVFFDEPTTGLDPITSSIINKLIVSCVKSIGATAITITHDLASCRQIGDRVGLMHQGKLLWEGKVSEMDNSPHPAMQQFIQGNEEGPLTAV